MPCPVPSAAGALSIRSFTKEFSGSPWSLKVRRPDTASLPVPAHVGPFAPRRRRAANKEPHLQRWWNARSGHRSSGAGRGKRTFLLGRNPRGKKIKSDRKQQQITEAEQHRKIFAEPTDNRTRNVRSESYIGISKVAEITARRSLQRRTSGPAPARRERRSATRCRR